MTVKTRLNPDVHAAAKDVAAMDGVSLTEYVSRLVHEDLKARNLGDGTESPRKSENQIAGGVSDS